MYTIQVSFVSAHEGRREPKLALFFPSRRLTNNNNANANTNLTMESSFQKRETLRFRFSDSTL